VGHIERFNPAVVEMVRQAKEPSFYRGVRLGPYDPRVSNVSVVLDLMIHDLDIVLALAQDKVVRLDAVGGRVLSNQEDIVKATLSFRRGCRADISASRVSLKKFRKIRVFQKDAYMSLDYSERSLENLSKKTRSDSEFVGRGDPAPAPGKKGSAGNRAAPFSPMREGGQTAAGGGNPRPGRP
jgi:predicted dehydrogenase